LFGEGAELAPPFSILAGEYTITASRDSDQATICRISVKHGQSRRQCPLVLEDVLKVLADLGAQYPDVVEVIRRLDECKSLTCNVELDALPQATTVYELAQAGKGGDLIKTSEEIVKARLNFNETPNLFGKADEGRPRRKEVEEAAAEDREIYSSRALQR